MPNRNIVALLLGAALLVAVAAYLAFNGGPARVLLYVECSDDGLRMEVTQNTLDFATRYDMPIGDIRYAFDTRFLRCGNTYEWQPTETGTAFRLVESG
ncbi:MAG: hypothetical protein AAF724_05320 [Pseudomonadota bacterium]